MMIKNYMTAGIVLMSLGVSALAQTTYTGNGNTGFGGAVGDGSLALSDNGTNVTISLTLGNGQANLGGNNLVIYIDSVAGGYSSTAGFMDNADGGRSAVSGYNSGSGPSVLTFASGFLPSYAIELGDGYQSLFGLADGGANSLNFIGTGVTSSGAYSITVPLSDLGLTPGAGQSFELFGTLISGTAYRSTEAIGGDDTGTQGNNPFTQTAGPETYTTTATPEPSSLALLGVSSLITFVAIRRRR